MRLNKEARQFFTEAGRKGGKATRAKLTPERRRQIAKKAAAARWRKSK